MIKVGFVGAGNRVKNFNQPALAALKDKFEIIGHTTKTGQKHASLGNYYSSIESLTKDADLLVISVPAHSNIEPIKRVLVAEKPMLLETPLGINIQHAETVYNILQNSNTKVGILEQWPFLPFELFKKKVINSGLIGPIVAVENDYRTYEYHGMAQLRSYLDPDASPVDIKTQRSLLKIHDGRPDPWVIISVRYNNGSILIYKYSDMYKRVEYRPQKALRIYGTSGTIVGDCLHDLNNPCIVKSFDNVYRPYCQHTREEIISIFFTPEAEEKIEWRNPFAGTGLNEHQVAVALHFEQMYDVITSGANPLYSVRDSLVDTMMVGQ